MQHTYICMCLQHKHACVIRVGPASHYSVYPSLQEERERQAKLRGAPKIDPNAAAIIIQKVLFP